MPQITNYFSVLAPKIRKKRAYQVLNILVIVKISSLQFLNTYIEKKKDI